MKIAVKILTIILLQFIGEFPLFAQVKQKNDSEIILEVSSENNCRTSGDFLFVTNDIFKKEFTDIVHVKKLDDKTILLQKKDCPYYRTKIEVDKGYISSFNIGSDRIKGWRELIDLENPNAPFSIFGWSVGGLNKNEKSITIKISHAKKDVLFAEKNYSLIPQDATIYYAFLEYRDLNGEAIRYPDLDLRRDYRSVWQRLPIGSIDFEKPINVVVEDSWGVSYEVKQFGMKRFDSMGNVLEPVYIGNAIADGAKQMLMVEARSHHTIFVYNIQYVKEGKTYYANPIEVIFK